ncbi:MULTISPECIES: phosphotransferase [unclassified Rhizobium]|jgi:Ser/Thr protein kinase RdoA (MazF antagonist)|uniref:aminoglycoside phosphotransferase family protein n=1 Tax=unclassified Rhizobium TaxID=2613769 RepID=UPI000648991C|nr:MULTISPECIES: phosphotransferase [unclassified Rhizobium]MBN8950354.1 aminoglycoside phosphotransferase family protein [Rhizobium tropici]OJY68890.1 MAG: aminoglycoside phosphotransferase [Rhizobium sp. 60-20]RKD74348.1 phosphotransferase family enzyme [Rhizobium sp. WW_1]
MGPSTGDEPFRQGSLIVRAVQPWTAGVHALLTALHRHGFDAVPLPYGFDEVWERVTYLPGETGDLDDSAEMRGERALRSAASLLRRYHDCSALFAKDFEDGHTWQLPARQPHEVICHGDFAPYNVVLNDGEVIGIIDFEAAHPGSRLWDLAYAIYRWAPLSSGVVPEGLDRRIEQIRRARLFADAYGLPVAERASLPDVIAERLEALLSFMEREAARGIERYRRNLQDGHDRIYRQDIAYVTEWSAEIVAGLTG